ncbi:glycosyltransferase family 4 protein [bacterium]|nr:glycosyltransferase family 4 protein [bacterium]
MNNKRVAIVIDSIGYGGAERLLVSLLSHMDRKSVNIDVIVLFSDLSLIKEFQKTGVNIITIDENYCSRWNIVKILYKILINTDNIKYDIVWGHLYFGNIYSTIFGIIKKITIVWTLHSPCVYTDKNIKFRHRFRQLFERILGGLSDLIVAVSYAVEEDYRHIMKWEHIKVIYNGVDFSVFPTKCTKTKGNLVRDRYKISPTDFLIVTPGRYAIEKGHMVILDALRILEDQYFIKPKWITAGHGGLKSYIQKKSLLEGLSDRFIMLDALIHSELLALMSCSDTIVIPSIREPFGIVAVEAMGLGIPLINSKVDGLIEVVGSHNCSVVISPGNSQELADAVFLLYSNYELRNKLAHNGYKRARKEFDILKCSKKWENLLIEL